MQPCPRYLLPAAFGLLMFAAQAAAQETRVAAAADADVIAIYSQHVERRLLRAHFDRVAETLVRSNDAEGEQSPPVVGAGRITRKDGMRALCLCRIFERKTGFHFS